MPEENKAVFNSSCARGGFFWYDRDMERDKNKQVIGIYNKIAKKYAEAFDNDRSDDRYVDRLLACLGRNGRILDLGCGTGRLAGYMQAKGFEVVGVDLSEKMLEIAKRKHPGIGFILADMRELELEEKSFDAVCLAYSIFHFEKPEAREILKKANVFLRPGGFLFLIVQEGEGEVFENDPLFPEDKIFLSLYSENEMVRIAEDSGFGVVRIERCAPANQDVEFDFNKLIAICRKV
ncbi:MAG: class I SAM-dependent methyltransferase [Candidatus Moranbacteria bacterium]|nr:class I SAM-dependent methyltransferase [Candidatus Moranbacteria bacterium]MDZ4384973.1 class I SAM-dependent methyltransferase [Candidatus Moranbacteria bacterium]